MEGRGYELDELIRRSKTGSDSDSGSSDSVKVFQKTSDTREAMWWVPTPASPRLVLAIRRTDSWP